MDSKSPLARAVLIAEALERAVAQKPGVSELLDHFPRDVMALASYGLEIPVMCRPTIASAFANR